MSADAHKIVIGRSNVVNKDIEHEYITCSENDKLSVLLKFLVFKQEEPRDGIFAEQK